MKTLPTRTLIADTVDADSTAQRLYVLVERIDELGASGDTTEAVFGAYRYAAGFISALAHVGQISRETHNTLIAAFGRDLDNALVAAAKAREARAARVAAGDTTGVRLQVQVLD